MKDYDYTKAAELLALAEEEQLSLAEVCLRREAARGEANRELLLQRMTDHYRSMRESIRKGLEIDGRSPSGLSGGDAKRLYAYSQTESPLFGADFAKAIAYGFAVLEVNAQFGRIVATPTAGSAGIVPACLYSLEQMHGLSEERAGMALFSASAVGIVIGANASFSGARGGCQAEVGSASCMAAAAIVEAVGGKPAQALEASAYALMNTLGLVCDPIGGFVEVPCVSRNGMFAVHSFLAATMALAGSQCVVPLDDVIIAMHDIGRRLPRALKETSTGGLAITPTGQRYQPPKFSGGHSPESAD